MTEEFFTRGSAEPSALTAADASVLQPTDGAKESGRLVRHPSTAFYDDVFETLLPALASLAEQKNVPLDPPDHAPLLRHALDGISRKTMHGIMSGNPHAIFTVTQAINRTLDLITAMRVAHAMLQVERKEGPFEVVLAIAENVLTQNFANDRAPTMQIWPDVTQMVADHYARMNEAEQAPPLVTLPDAARVLSSVKQKRGRRKKVRHG